MDQRRPGSLLNRLSTVVAKTEVHRFLDLYCIQYAVDGLGRQRPILRVARNVSFIDLEARASQLPDLGGEGIGDGESQRAKIMVMLVQQRASEHIRAGERKLERAAGDTGGARAVLGQVEASLGYWAGNDSRGFEPKPHLAFRPEGIGVAPAD